MHLIAKISFDDGFYELSGKQSLKIVTCSLLTDYHTMENTKISCYYLKIVISGANAIFLEKWTIRMHFI